MNYPLILNIMFAIVLAAFFAWLYLLPSQIAIRRKNKHAGLLMALNILLGWTVVVWIGTLIWSLVAANPAENTQSATRSVA